MPTSQQARCVHASAATGSLMGHAVEVGPIGALAIGGADESPLCAARRAGRCATGAINIASSWSSRSQRSGQHRPLQPDRLLHFEVLLPRQPDRPCRLRQCAQAGQGAAQMTLSVGTPTGSACTCNPHVAGDGSDVWQTAGSAAELGLGQVKRLLAGQALDRLSTAVIAGTDAGTGPARHPRGRDSLKATPAAARMSSVTVVALVRRARCSSAEHRHAAPGGGRPARCTADKVSVSDDHESTTAAPDAPWFAGRCALNKSLRVAAWRSLLTVPISPDQRPCPAASAMPVLNGRFRVEVKPGKPRPSRPSGGQADYGPVQAAACAPPARHCPISRSHLMRAAARCRALTGP